MRGWLGGACAEPTVVREALKALEEGSPRLLFLGPPEELEGRARDGVVTVPIACQSEGALEVYVEPVLPQPQLVAIGRSPAATALAAMAAGLGWRSVLVDDGGDAEGREGVGRVLTTLDLAQAGVDDRSFVVVATQGHYDEDALERALATPAAYVGLVASRKRAEAVLGYLRDRGVPTKRSRASTRRPGSTSATSRPMRSPSRSWRRSCSSARRGSWRPERSRATCRRDTRRSTRSAA